MTTISPSFCRVIQRNLEYWLRETATPTPEKQVWLFGEQGNLEQALYYGRGQEETLATAVALTLQIFPLLEQWGYKQLWLPHLNHLHQQIERYDPPLAVGERADVLNRLGQLQRDLGDLTLALQTHELAFSLVKDTAEEVPLTYARICYQLSLDYRTQQALPLAQQFALDGLETLNQLPLTDEVTRLQATILTALGQISEKIGDNPTSIRYYLAACEQWARTDDPLNWSRTLINLSVTYSKVGEVEAAEQVLQEASQKLDPYQHLPTYLYVQNNFAYLYFTQQNYGKMEQIIRHTILPHQTDPRFGVEFRGMILSNLGYCLSEQGRYEEAEESLRESLPHQRASLNLAGLGNTLGCLAKTVAQQGRVAEAVPIYQEALAILAPLSQNSWAHEQKERCQAELDALLVGHGS